MPTDTKSCYLLVARYQSAYLPSSSLLPSVFLVLSMFASLCIFKILRFMYFVFYTTPSSSSIRFPSGMGAVPVFSALGRFFSFRGNELGLGWLLSFWFSIPSLDWKDGGYKGHEHRLEVRSSALFCLDGEKRWCGFIVWFRQNDIFYILLLALGLLEVSVVRND